MPQDGSVFEVFQYGERNLFSMPRQKLSHYGIDEGWLDVTESSSIKGDGMKIAQEISDRIKYELALPPWY